jgi:hypothetical protein
MEQGWFDKFQLHFGSPTHSQVRSSWQLHIPPFDFSDWIKSQNVHILCFDGASKGNPGVAGAGGVILDLGEIKK